MTLVLRRIRIGPLTSAVWIAIGAASILYSWKRQAVDLPSGTAFAVASWLVFHFT